MIFVYKGKDDMSQRIKYLLKNIGLLITSNFASKILVFLLVPLYTSVLSTSEYGVYDLIISIVYLIYPIFTLNIIDAVMRFCMDKTFSKYDVVSIGIKYVCLSIGLFCAFILLIKKTNVGSILENTEKYMLFYYITYVFYQFFLQLAKGLEKIRDISIAGIISTAIMLISNILFLVILKWGVSGFFLSAILSQLVPVLYFVLRLNFWKYIRSYNRNKQLEIKMLKYCTPLIFTVLGWWINSAADRVIVTTMCGIGANGLLAISYKIPSIINTLQGVIIQAWQISAIREYDKKNVDSFYAKTFSFSNLFMVLVCAFLIILTKPLAHILYAKEFYVAWKYVPFLLISSVFNCASGFIGPILSAKKDSKNMALSAIYGGTANILLNVFLIDIIGIQGATIATAICSYIIFFYRYKSIKNDFDICCLWKLNLSWILLVVLCILEICCLAVFFKIAIVALIIIINRDDLVNIKKNIIKLIKK